MNYFKKSSSIAQLTFGFILAVALIFVPSFATQNHNTQIGQLLQEFGKKQNNQNTNQQAVAQTSTNQPLPQSTAQAIMPDKMVLDSPVMDYAQILNHHEKQHLSEQLYKIYQDRLAQAVLVIVPTTDGVPIFDYTMAVAKRFGLGRKQVDDGILIMVAVNDRKLFIATGYGVEGVLPDGAISRIIREDIKPSFKNGAYAQGLSAGIARIDERLRADPDTLARADRQAEQKSSPVDVVALFVPALIVGLFLTNLFGRLLGASVATGGFAFFALSAGVGLFGVLIAGVVLWLFLLIFSRGGIVIPTGNHRGGGSFGNGGGHTGGFGSKGGFSGGGGSFGGGGAGGSW